MPSDGELATLKLYWKNISAINPEAQLPKLGLLLLDIKAHAADPERTVSMMGWFNSQRHSQLLSTTTTGMTMVKMFNTKVPDRCCLHSFLCTYLQQLTCPWCKVLHLLHVTIYILQVPAGLGACTCIVAYCSLPFAIIQYSIECSFL